MNKLAWAHESKELFVGPILKAGKLQIRDEKGDYTPIARGILWDGYGLDIYRT